MPRPEAGTRWGSVRLLFERGCRLRDYGRLVMPEKSAAYGWRSGNYARSEKDPSECRQHALDRVRMAQTATTPEARKTWSDLAKTWLRFASDLEANERLLDEWGRHRPKRESEWRVSIEFRGLPLLSTGGCDDLASDLSVCH